MNKIIAPTIGFTFLAQIVVFLIGLGNNMIISRLLQPEGLGVLALVIVIVELVSRIVNPGLDTAAIYFIGNRRFEFKKFIGTYAVNTLIIISLGILALFIIGQSQTINIFSTIIDFKIIKNYLPVISCYFAAFLFYEFSVKLPLGLQKYREYNNIQLIKPIILFMMLMASVLIAEVRLEYVVLLLSISFLVPALLYWRYALPVQINWDKQITLESLSFGIKVMFSNFIQYLNYRADIFLIGFFLSGFDVGIYYVSVLIAERMLFLTQATSIILYPSASNSELQREKTPLLSRLNFLVVLAASFLIGITAYWLVPFLFSEKYAESVLPLVILLPGIVSLSVSKILSADFASRGLPGYNAYVSLLNFCLNITLNIILIPKLQIAGAALSSSISYTAALILHAYFYNKLTSTRLSELFFIRKGDIKRLKHI